MNTQYTKEEKQALVLDWQKSGQSQTSFCATHGLKRRTFGSWVRQYSQPENDESSGESFIPLTWEPPAGSSFKVHYPGGLCLECPADIPMHQLVELLRLTSGV